MTDAEVGPFFATLAAANPHPRSELVYASVFELLAAVLLSAQATDVSVNKATRALFARAPTPQAMLALGLDGLTAHIRSIGLYRTKASNLLQTCRLLVERHGGAVPCDRAALEALPGVGRKTANVVLNIAFGEPTIAVDTHIFRVANRTGLAARAHAAGGRAAPARARAGALPAARAPLADPARTLRVPGAPAALRGLRGAALVRPRPPTIRRTLTPRRRPAAPPAPAPMATLRDLAERIERLVLRHEELQRAHALLAQELEAVTTERDSLKARLAAARARIDALLARLPEDDPA